ncbi:MAG TPA: acyl-CoA dehydrogenase family protein [Jatrophihabitans sp.]|nr:acyl-CoA dehydrogenase family protein [Jatrophihabitans sp.]
MPTHEVSNVPAAWTGANLYLQDRALLHASAALDSNDRARLAELGARAGTPQAQDWGRLANENEPVLRSFDRYGHRIDEVEFHPAWHELMSVAVSAGLQAAPWAPAAGEHAHLARAAGFFVWGQVEQGHLCPISMSYAVLPALRRAPELAASYEPGLLATSYDFGLRAPLAKQGLLAGMAMTEKQGGSDVRANTTRALAQPDGSYRLTGHKWFCSAPMCDLFLVLAQAEAGLSCFLVPRILPDGSRNPFALQRLKDKLGNRSNASSEVEFDGTVGWLVGEPGRGVRTIIDMVTMTRLDCVIGAAATQRAALTQALHHVHGRAAFGATLADQPLMQEVLADLAVETDAATHLALRLAEAVDRGETSLLRIAVAAAKFWVCKRTATVTAEALECLGGNGYVEESPMPRYFRESPLNSIWEGSGNVIALDVLRALGREPAAVDSLVTELEVTAGVDPRLDEAVRRLHGHLAEARRDPAAVTRHARQLTGQLARTLQASLLVRSADEADRSRVAEAFLDSRLTAEPPAVFGGRPVPEARRLMRYANLAS